jgi:hypothetical protein
MQQGAFAEAEAAYAVERAVHPRDPQLPQKQRAAQVELIRQRITGARAMRLAGRRETALSMLDQGLRLQARWSARPSADVLALQDEEIAAADGLLAEVMRPRLDGQQPLGALKRLDDLLPRPVHPRLDPARRRAEAAINAAGRARCTELRARYAAAAPHVARLLASYCGAFGIVERDPPLPEQRRGLRISGRLENVPDAQNRAIETWIAEGFRASPWYAADATELAGAELAGAYDARLERHWVTRVAPYRVHERATVRDPAMPWARTHIDTNVERPYQYEAEQYDAHYELQATIKLDMAEGPPMLLRLAGSQDRRAFQHNETFEPAGVHPQRADLPSVGAWLDSYLSQRRRSIVRKLRTRWAKSFCATPRFTLDEAARCALGGEWPATLPPILRSALGPETDLMLDNLLLRPSNDPEADAVKPAGPRKTDDKKTETPPPFEETPAPSHGDIETI